MACCKIQQRWLMAVLAHIGFVVVYALRVNLSVALVAMVNNTYANPDQGNDPECSTGNRTVEAYNVSRMFYS